MRKTKGKKLFKMTGVFVALLTKKLLTCQKLIILLPSSQSPKPYQGAVIIHQQRLYGPHEEGNRRGLSQF
jgi:hypothetical protein